MKTKKGAEYVMENYTAREAYQAREAYTVAETRTGYKTVWKIGILGIS